MQIKFRVAQLGTVTLCSPTRQHLSACLPLPGAKENDLAGDRMPMNEVILQKDKWLGRGKQSEKDSSTCVSGKAGERVWFPGTPHPRMAILMQLVHAPQALGGPHFCADMSALSVSSTNCCPLGTGLKPLFSLAFPFYLFFSLLQVPPTEPMRKPWGWVISAILVCESHVRLCWVRS